MQSKAKPTFRTALSAALSSDPGHLVERAMQLHALDRQLRQSLPEPLASHVKLGNLRDDRLVFLVDAPVWKARLRLYADILVDAARAAGIRASGIASLVVDRNSRAVLAHTDRCVVLERGRVALTKLMLRKDNLLLLDEPTNHLDMDSREVLEDALQDFPGTILAISHDRYFINRFADRVMVMNSDGVTEYLGNFDDYVEKRDRPQPPAPAAEGEVTRTAATRERKRDRQQAARARELQAQVKRAEEAIEENERLLRELEAKLADPATYADAEAARELGERYRAEQARSEALYEALEAAEAEAEAAE